MRKFFGTDGIRGRTNTEPMTATTALKVAQAAAYYFKTHENHRPRVVLGKDTRLSGYMLEQAMTAGFLSMGMDVTLVGPMPTPAIAMLTRSLRADMGVMISASHNPYEDNGIKLFGADGFKLSDEVELEIESLIESDLSGHLADPADIGRASRVDEESGRYVEFVKNTFPREGTLHGLKVVIDCANGAAYKAAPKVLWELGAEIIPIGINPNGKNINKFCGATDTLAMQEAVVAHGADIGLSLDGDADRLIVADELGRRLNGDQIVAAIATYWHKTGQLKGGGVAMTVLSNTGLERYLNSLGLNLVRAQVGDRYVMQALNAHGMNLGGEESGHFIALDYNTTGDGLMAALQVLAALQDSGKKASEVLRCFEPLPQVQKSVRYTLGQNPLDNPALQAQLAAVEADVVKAGGRVLIRKSGTEPVIRVMAEGDDVAQIDAWVAQMCQAIDAQIKTAA